jgi:hypothetical protein
MTTHKFVTLLATSAIALSAFTMTAPAQAGGVFGDALNLVVPGAGTQLDNLNREIKNRSSDASVYNQIMNARIPDAPFRAAPGYANVPPAARPPMPFCYTPAGAFGPDQSLNFPAGTPCWWALPNGQVFNGQIVWG